MKYFAKGAQLGMALLLLSTVARAQPGGGHQVLQPGLVGEPMRSFNTIGINEDVPFSIDPICGIVITIHSATQPYSFYNNDRNPWGQPAIIPFVDSQGPGWTLIFGGSNGPCFSRSNPIFYENHDVTKRFLGLHFGFYTDATLGTFTGAPCWMIGANQTTVPCSGITGYYVTGHRLHLLNHAAMNLAVQNAMIAASPKAIATDDLNRIDLPDLAWRSLSLENNLLPAAEGDLPGTLIVEIPEDLQKQGGDFAVFSYDVVDPETSEVHSTVTLEFAIRK